MKTALTSLRLLDMLSGINRYTREELMDRLELSERSLYRHLNTLKNFGFVIDSSGGRYIIEKNNKTVRDLSSLLHFSEEEAYILNEAINRIETTTKARENLVSKLSALYDSDRIAIRFVAKENSSRIKPVLDAIRLRKKVKIIGYQSSDSGKIDDRIVEPFVFTPNYISVWSYEEADRKNKLFKVDRMHKVELLEVDWKHEQHHHADLLDCFRIGGKKKLPVKFEMTLRGKNLLTEEYPLSAALITEIHQDHYLYDGWVTSYEGVGRFILGLPEEIFNIKPTQLTDFLKKRIKKYDFFSC
jgi:proteasome accessory factor C